MSIIEFAKQANRAVDWKRFRTAWDDCNRDMLFDIWSDARANLSLDTSYAIFDKGYQYRSAFSSNCKIAKNEFLQMVIGVW